MKFTLQHHSKSQLIIDFFFNNEFFNETFLNMAKYEFVDFEVIFQNVLYFIGVNNEDINIEYTNKLNWKKARKFWTVEVLEKLRDYTPFGPKKEKVSYYALINRQVDIFFSLMEKFEEIKAYNFVLYKLFEFMYLSKFCI